LGHPILKFERPLDKDELIRAIRLFIAAEQEAVQMYMQAAEATDDKDAQAVLKSISDEELVHVGEFSQLLAKLSPHDAEMFEKGYQQLPSNPDNP